MLVDSFSFTHDETAASVDSQAQLLVEAGWRLPRPRLRLVADLPCDEPECCKDYLGDDEVSAHAHCG